MDADRNGPEVPACEDDRLDVPGVVEDYMLMGSIKHAMDEQLLKNLQVACLIDAENPRKRSAHPEVVADPTIEVGHIDLDDDFSYDDFKTNVMAANKLIQIARADNKTVFVFCTHGNNESAVVCIAYLMVVEQWTLEHAYRHVLQKRPASAPRKTYVEKLRALELETHGRVTLRSDQIGPSMIDLMLGLRGQTPVNDDTDERSSQATDGGTSTVERASVMSNFSVVTGLTNGRSVRETMIIAEQEDELVASGGKAGKLSPGHGRRMSKPHKVNCIIS
ncbi:hypothetical protein BBO99_00006044 [Phytophthora kernoviae]|uniref:protein-tyrosine-phosphatase n=2 Tax=Phytophthora kernoviae TaxID=325452 RepID=A0A3R7JY70_9STRA|nr:hypothetical protein G195_005913 [Phytophthora kernoviae 00238/432]KAG2523920.1 hypothetical protein JM16_005168 [Phytophthora kernoviae]KAG2525722.1 hypothetical protein JM18_004744 [Phytophthora kernoviae]RLN32131.1 hypothetical protein BBI17_006117 [Phytophthora kernoviae]RLN78307.1 hypothetical protein BBO99_00006044 [Phytophthora kernoviae]